MSVYDDVGWVCLCTKMSSVITLHASSKFIRDTLCTKCVRGVTVGNSEHACAMHDSSDKVYTGVEGLDVTQSASSQFFLKMDVWFWYNTFAAMQELPMCARSPVPWKFTHHGQDAVGISSLKRWSWFRSNSGSGLSRSSMGTCLGISDPSGRSGSAGYFALHSSVSEISFSCWG